MKECKLVNQKCTEKSALFSRSLQFRFNKGKVNLIAAIVDSKATIRASFLLCIYQVARIRNFRTKNADDIKKKLMFNRCTYIECNDQLHTVDDYKNCSEIAVDL